MKKIIFILLCLLTTNVYAEPYAFLFTNNTFVIANSPFAYSERVARLSDFQIITSESTVVYQKADWAIQAEQLFYQGMVTNGFGEPPWTNQTFESVGMTLLQRTINGSTEDERNQADRWKGVLESIFNKLLSYHNSYRTQYSQSPITAIWEYPLNSSAIYSNQVISVFILYDNQPYFPK